MPNVPHSNTNEEGWCVSTFSHCWENQAWTSLIRVLPSRASDVIWSLCQCCQLGDWLAKSDNFPNPLGNFFLSGATSDFFSCFGHSGVNARIVLTVLNEQRVWSSGIRRVTLPIPSPDKGGGLGVELGIPSSNSVLIKFDTLTFNQTEQQCFLPCGSRQNT